MKVMNLLLNGLDNENIPEWAPVCLYTTYHCKHQKILGGTWHVCSLPVQDAHGGLSVFNEAHSAVAVPLVLDGHAADLHHHIPQLLGCAPTLLRTWELFACWSQELTDLSEGNRRDEFYQVSNIPDPVGGPSSQSLCLNLHRAVLNFPEGTKYV